MVTTNSFKGLKGLVQEVNDLETQAKEKEKSVSLQMKEFIKEAIQILRPVVKYIEKSYGRETFGFSEYSFSFKKGGRTIRGLLIGVVIVKSVASSIQLPLFLTRNGLEALNEYGHSELSELNDRSPCHKHPLDLLLERNEDELEETVEAIHSHLRKAVDKLQDRLGKLQVREEKIKAATEILQS